MVNISLQEKDVISSTVLKPFFAYFSEFINILSKRMFFGDRFKKSVKRQRPESQIQRLESDFAPITDIGSAIQKHFSVCKKSPVPQESSQQNGRVSNAGFVFSASVSI